MQAKHVAGAFSLCMSTVAALRMRIEWLPNTIYSLSQEFNQVDDIGTACWLELS